MNKLILVLLVTLVACDTAEESQLKTTFINPAIGYSQVVKIETEGVATIYVSGQIGEGDDLATQMTSALENLRIQLNASGATFKDIVKMNTYIVDYQPEDLAIFRDTRKAIMGDADMPASTLVGVTALALPEWKIEIEAIAVIED
jgi:2-iminobutanoate/2-iminopropanoate deaminase